VSRRVFRALVSVTAALLALSAIPSFADGSLPPLPYRYLHPPAALAPQNNLPKSGAGAVAVSGGRSSAASIFTGDGQAGLIAPAGAFAVSSSVHALQIRITPVNAPAGLPLGLAVDGNAYQYVASSPPKVMIAVVLQWPHIPSELDEYRNGAWHRICYSSNAILTSRTVLCHAASLGIFAALVPGTFTSVAPSTGPTSSSPGNTIAQAIPFILATIVILVALGLGLIIARPRRKTK
jgi:hypothetical protein